MYWMNLVGFLPDVCWEKMGEARNLRNPQWNTSSSLDLIGSVLLGCLRTKTCMTDIYAQKKKKWGQQNLFCVAGAALLTKRKHFRCEYLLFVGQERHENQRFAWLDTLHHRKRHINDVQGHIPAILKRGGQQSEWSQKSWLNMRAFTAEDKYCCLLYHGSILLSCSLSQYAAASALKALELEYTRIVEGQVFHGVPRWRAETF